MVDTRTLGRTLLFFEIRRQPTLGVEENPGKTLFPLTFRFNFEPTQNGHQWSGRRDLITGVKFLFCRT